MANHPRVVELVAEEAGVGAAAEISDVCIRAGSVGPCRVADSRRAAERFRSRPPDRIQTGPDQPHATLVGRRADCRPDGQASFGSASNLLAEEDSRDCGPGFPAPVRWPESLETP
jgi:hypothetical protein